jgi:hypothetical protein
MRSRCVCKKAALYATETLRYIKVVIGQTGFQSFVMFSLYWNGFAGPGSSQCAAVWLSRYTIVISLSSQVCAIFNCAIFVVLVISLLLLVFQYCKVESSICFSFENCQHTAFFMSNTLTAYIVMI